MIFPILAAALAAAPVSYDAKEHSVTFTATAVGMPASAQIEFLFAGPGSDHDYESLFITDAEVGEIAKAFEKAGVPLGRPVDPAAARFWPVGDELEMTPAFTNIIRETYGEPVPSIAYTGGKRDGKGNPEAATNMPLAVFALYSMPQALIQLDDALDQSATYGRFRPLTELPKGERHTFKFTWKGRASNLKVNPKFMPGSLQEALESLKAAAKPNVELDVTPSFSPMLTVKEAMAAAMALSMVDSRAVKMNGYADGELFYQAFMPKESWRDRTQRLCQPPELHLKGDGSCIVTEIHEDWSGEETLDPKLTPEEHSFKSDAEAADTVSKLAERTQTALVFCPEDTRLSRLYALRKSVKLFIPNWYIFTE